MSTLRYILVPSQIKPQGNRKALLAPKGFTNQGLCELYCCLWRSAGMRPILRWSWVKSKF